MNTSEPPFRLSSEPPEQIGTRIRGGTSVNTKSSAIPIVPPRTIGPAAPGGLPVADYSAMLNQARRLHRRLITLSFSSAHPQERASYISQAEVVLDSVASVDDDNAAEIRRTIKRLKAQHSRLRG
jgi:hypothetical protein